MVRNQTLKMGTAASEHHQAIGGKSHHTNGYHGVERPGQGRLMLVGRHYFGHLRVVILTWFCC
jgi:hypothetical protein